MADAALLDPQVVYPKIAGQARQGQKRRPSLAKCDDAPWVDLR